MNPRPLTDGARKEAGALAVGLGLAQIQTRLARLRAGRRRIGWFDFCSDSWDMRTTAQRALRIYLRLQGIRSPLESETGRPVPWNTFHH